MNKIFSGNEAIRQKKISKLSLRGLNLLFQRLQAWNLIRPSLPERILIRILNDLEVRFGRRKRVGNGSYTLSFYLPDTNQAIQIRSLHAEFSQQKRQTTNTTADFHSLLKQERISCLLVSDAELLHDDLSPVIRKVERFIAQVQARREIEDEAQRPR